MTAQLRGTVERLVFSSPDTHYVVARLRPKDTADLVTITGRLPELKEGEEVWLEGRWRTHKRYGRQFEVERYRIEVPTTTVGIERYLASGLVHGIGPELAHRLVQHFGEHTLDIIEAHPERLLEVEGIGPKRQKQIVESVAAQRGVRDVMVFLQQHGVSPTVAAKVYKAYGPSAVAVVRDNPYRLAADIFGVGFRTADKIAASMGIGHDSPVRAEAQDAGNGTGTGGGGGGGGGWRIILPQVEQYMASGKFLAPQKGQRTYLAPPIRRTSCLMVSRSQPLI